MLYDESFVDRGGLVTEAVKLLISVHRAMPDPLTFFPSCCKYKTNCRIGKAVRTHLLELYFCRHIIGIEIGHERNK